MHRIKFSSNMNGKLCNDVFPDIRLYDFDKYADFTKLEVEYKGQLLGIVEIVAKNPFLVRSLNDQTSIVNCGHEMPYQRRLLRNFYPHLTDDGKLYMLFLKWVERYKEPTEFLFKERFEKVTEGWQQPHTDLQTQISFE